MAKPKVSTRFQCPLCSFTSHAQFFRCHQCKEYVTPIEITQGEGVTAAAQAGFKATETVKPVKKALSIQELNNTPIKRTLTHIGELDRVLGGGFVEAEVVLFAGPPGTGKSTLSLAVAAAFAKQGQKVLYTSGEESEQQIGLRARRMGVADPLIRIVNETNLETIMGHIEEEQPQFMIVDSLQTLASSAIPGSIGSVSQSKEAANLLTNLAKKKKITMILVSQVVKDGSYAGSEAIQHVADCSLMLESDSDSPLKFLRAHKNRFGDTAEVGIFQHTEAGLEEVSDPAGILLDNEADDVSGASCSFVSEGMRQMPVEIQALVTLSSLTNPRKQFNGVHPQRGQIVCAILDKFCGGELFANDVFISTVSGVRVSDPQADLSMAASLLSSKLGKPIPSDTVFIGELSLTGQVRGGFMLEAKLKEAQRLGFKRVVAPKSALKGLSKKPQGLSLVGIASVAELSKIL